MEDYTKILTNISKAIPVVYIMGFTVINAHLSKYGFSDFEVLNATYLKAGVLITLLLSILFIAVFLSFSKETMTDDFSKAWPSQLTVIYNICFLTIFFTPIFSDTKSIFTEGGAVKYTFLISILLHAYFRIWSMNKSPKNNLGIIFLTVTPIVLIIPAIIILCIRDSQILYLFGFLGIIGCLMSLSLSELGDGNYKARLITDVAVLLTACYFFGYTFYDKLPGKFGGGKPYYIEYLKPIDINDSIPKKEKAQVIYENNSRILLKNPKNEIFFTLKSEIKSYKIIPLTAVKRQPKFSLRNKRKFESK